jgi:outer membrane protein OmpA-like peptidoglycan-associated protein
LIASWVLLQEARGQGFDAQRYAPPAGSAGGLLVERAMVPERLAWSVGLFADVADNPVIVSDPDTGEVLSRPVDTLVVLDLMGSVAVLGRLELALDIPLVPVASGDDLGLGGQLLSAEPGLGDLRFVPKVLLLGDYRSPTVLSLAMPITMPTGDAEAMRGAGEASIEPKLLLTVRGGSVRVHGSTGLRARPGLEALDPIGSEWTYGLGLTWVVVRPLDLLVEASGAADLTRGGPALTDVPLELLGGVLWRPDRSWTVTAGAGPGLTDGLGTPDVRVVAGVRFMDHADDKPGDIDERSAPTDTDGDDIPDEDDSCVRDPEDDDGYLDRDGCPEPDNDEDGVLDDDDECPQVAEERGGDGDGCPERGRVRMGADRVEVEGKILFQVDSASLDPRSDDLLDDLADLLEDHPEVDRFEIQGHTDDTGPAEYNEDLSDRRAQSVRQALIQRGVEPDRLTTRGYGERRPIAPNDTPAGRAQNRRVEFVVKG